MNFLRIVITSFLLVETINVLALYFFPGSKYANAVGIFTAWEKSKEDPDIHNFVKYLVNWVAGAKLIFIMLLIVITFTADDQALVFTGIALVISIGSFFVRLFPLIRQMDHDGQITPKKYSIALGWMIAAFIVIILGGVILSVIG